MSVNPSQAASAYQNTVRQVESGVSGGDSVERGGPSFADMVGDAAGGALNTMRGSEAVSMEALSGNADITDVVTAVNNAEITLQAVVAIRDRVIGAYQQIMRMPM